MHRMPLVLSCLKIFLVEGFSLMIWHKNLVERNKLVGEAALQYSWQKWCILGVFSSLFNGSVMAWFWPTFLEIKVHSGWYYYSRRRTSADTAISFIIHTRHLHNRIWCQGHRSNFDQRFHWALYCAECDRVQVRINNHYLVFSCHTWLMYSSKTWNIFIYNQRIPTKNQIASQFWVQPKMQR